MHNEELHNLYASLDIIRVIKSRWIKQVRHVACIGEMRNAYKTLVRKPEGRRPLGRPRHRWEDNKRMYLKEVEWDGADWLYLAKEGDHWWALVNKPLDSITGREFLDCLSDLPSPEELCFM
jgi:hypothetical protein